ncbi:MAG: 23S rRNA (pseudouridine(1915)-N(3))-methyltransferase RlmH [bacterium]|nr:23S rRNA (pseudouridine(1915)-N(3))-methyltransferase RlmH [bacterium]
MIKISLISVGSLKENYYNDAAKEYEKRLSKYCTLNCIEIEPTKLNNSPSLSEIEAALKIEGQKIIQKIPRSAFIVSLCIEGKQLSSDAFASTLENLPHQGYSNICFVIGSSYGLDKEIKLKSNLRLSISPMTFPHRLARIMLLEQLYRCFKISEGSNYHK